jgi:hypothetical protein
LNSIQKWADTHANLPIRARWKAKANVAPIGSNYTGFTSALLLEGFVFSGSVLIAAQFEMTLGCDQSDAPTNTPFHRCGTQARLPAIPENRQGGFVSSLRP